MFRQNQNTANRDKKRINTDRLSDLQLFIGCLLLVLAFMLVYTRLFFPYFETNDDMTAARIVDGSKGIYDPHLIIQHTFLGYLLCFLYQSFHAVAWYTVLQYIVITLSLSAIGFSLFRMIKTEYACALYLFILLICSYECYIVIQYTRTGGLAAVAGTGLLLTAYKRKCHALSVAACGYVLLTFAFLYRSNMTVICMGLMCPAIFLHVLEEPASLMQKVRRVCSYVLPALVLFSALYLGDKACYQGEYWAKFRAFDNARIELLDYGLPPYSDENARFLLDEYGIDSDGYLMLATWSYADPEIFTAEALQAMVDMKPDIDYINRQQLKVFLKTVPGTLMRKHVLILILMGAFFWLLLARHDRKDVMLFLLTVLFTGVLYYYLYCNNRWQMNRIAFPLFMAVTMSAVYLYRPKVQTGSMRKLLFSVVTLCLAGSLFTGVFADFSLLWRSSDKAKSMQAASKTYQRFVENSHNDTEHLYVCNVGTILRDGCYLPFDIVPENTLDNFLQMGGWTTYTPQYMWLMEENGIDNPLRSCIDSDRVLVISTQIGLTVNYLKAVTGLELEYETIPQSDLLICDDLPAYRVYSVENAADAS